MANRQPSRLARARLETTDDMYLAGVLDTEMREKITLRHLVDLASDGSALSCYDATGELSVI